MDELAKVRRVIAKQMPGRPARDADLDRRHHRPERPAPGEGLLRGGRASTASSSPSSTAPPRAASRWRSPSELGHPGEADRHRRDARGPAPVRPRRLRPGAARRLTPSKLGRDVRPALRPPPGDALRRPLARQAERGRRRRRDARDPPRPARGRRQLQGRQSLHRDAEGALPRRRGAREPRPRPAGGEDRQRGADRADGRRRPRPRLRLERADRDPDGRPAGLGQDDRLREARPLPRRGTARTSPSPPATSTAPPRSSSWSRVGERAGAHVYEQGTDARPGRDRRVGARPGPRGAPRRADRRHRRPPPRRRGADGRAGARSASGPSPTTSCSSSTR